MQCTRKCKFHPMQWNFSQPTSYITLRVHNINGRSTIPPLRSSLILYHWIFLPEKKITIRFIYIFQAGCQHLVPEKVCQFFEFKISPISLNNSTWFSPNTYNFDPLCRVSELWDKICIVWWHLGNDVQMMKLMRFRKDLHHTHIHTSKCNKFPVEYSQYMYYTI